MFNGVTMGKSKKVSVDLFCTNCGGLLEEVDGKNVCKSCGSEFVVEQAIASEVETVSTEEIAVANEVVSETKPKTKSRKKSAKEETPKTSEEKQAPVRESVILLQCKNCGGEIVMLDASHGVCKNCKTKYFYDTNLSDEIKTMLNEANKDRRMSNYDRAIIGYEEVLRKDATNAEAYFGLFISEYGIKYEVDIDGSYKPTCHRFSTESVYNNENYKHAIEYAISEPVRERYKADAAEIERIRLEVAEKVKKGESYDIFICYKKSDENGNDTYDSKRAWNIWKELTKLGYKVFFAEESLSGVTGEEYEPIIFTALSTCKVMLFMTSKTEWGNATWVKNEWSRYLKMIKNGEKESGSLIPICLGDLDAYGLPLELKNLQALFEKNINFFDVLRERITKLVNTYRAKSTLTRKEFKKQNFEPTTVIEREKIEKRKWGKTSEVVISASEEGELKNAFTFLQIGKFNLAQSKFISLIEKNPKNDQAILGLEMAKLRVHDEKEYERDIWHLYKFVKEDGKYKLPEFENLLASLNTEAFQVKLMGYFYEAVKVAYKAVKGWDLKRPKDDRYEKLCAFTEIYLSFNTEKPKEKEVIKMIKNCLSDILTKYKPTFEQTPYAKQAKKKYPCFNLWFMLFETYLKTNDIKTSADYSEALYKEMFKFCGEIKDVRVEAYVDKLIEFLPNNIGARLLKFVYIHGYTDYFVGKNLSQIKKMIDSVLPYDEENTGFISELIKQVDELMFTHKKYALGFKIFDYIIQYISKKYDDVLCDYLIKMGNIALFLGMYNETAKKYFNNVLSINPKDSRAHWGKLKTDIGIRDDFYLQFQKKDFTVYESCQNAINCSEGQDLNLYYMAIIERQVEKQEKKTKAQHVFNPIVTSIFESFPRYKDYYCKHFLESYSKHNKKHYVALRNVVQNTLVFSNAGSKEMKKQIDESKELLKKDQLSLLVIHNERDASDKFSTKLAQGTFRKTLAYAICTLLAAVVFGILASLNTGYSIPFVIVSALTFVASLLVPAIVYSYSPMGKIFKWILIILGVAIAGTAIVYGIIEGIILQVIGALIGGTIALTIGGGMIYGIIEAIKENI